jgi:hypothetical protein
MGKHGTEYARVARDAYPTPGWVVDALVEHVDIHGLRIWEPACGDGQMVRALEAHGASVHGTDIAGDSVDGIFDFCSRGLPCGLSHYSGIITNPPWSLADAFVELGLERIRTGGFMALLLPTDFDSAMGRRRFFHECPYFHARIILTKRIVWFERSDGIKAAPRESTAWSVWSRPVLRGRIPEVRYAPAPNGLAEAAA